MPDAAIVTTGLTKRFGRVDAVADLNLRVPAGSVYGFLGPNGSGKTTTIRMLLGLVFPTAGTATLLGGDGGRALERIGALVEGPAFHPYLSGTANLVRLDAADRTVDPRTTKHRVGTALDRVGLSPAAGKRYRAYSLGMRQRLGIAAALLRPRELLVLDEPTNGLDPQGTREIRSLVTELASDGVTVFLSTHLLGEVQQICTDVGVMSDGRLVWQGPLAELGARQTPRVRVQTAQPDAAAQVLTRLASDVTVLDGDVLAELPDGLEPEAIVAALVAAGVGVRGFAIERASLEDVFVELTGEGFDVSG